jgi:hypothetical protein
MKEFIKNPTVLMIGAGVLAFIGTRYVLNMKSGESTDLKSLVALPKIEKKSGACGCGA